MENIKVFDSEGNIIEIPANTPVNDLTKAPIFEDMPEGSVYIPIVVPAKDGTPRIALMNPTVLATTKEITHSLVESVNESRSNLVKEFETRDFQLQDAVTKLKSHDDMMDQISNTLTEKSIEVDKSIKDINDQNTAINVMNNTLVQNVSNIHDHGIILEQHDLNLQEKDDQLSEMVSDLQSKNTQLQNMVGKLQDIDSELKTKDTQLQNMVNSLRSMSESLELKNTEIEDMISKINLLNNSLIAKDLEIDDMIRRLNLMDNSLATKDLELQNMITTLNAKASIIELANITVSQTATIALGAEIRRFVISGVSGLKANDKVIILPKTTLPVNYGISAVLAPTDGTLNVYLNCPPLILGGVFSIIFRVIVIR